VALLSEAAPLCEREAFRVVVGHHGLDRVESALAGPIGDGSVETGAGTAASGSREHRHERGDQVGPLWLDRSDRVAADGSVEPREELDVLELARAIGPRLGEAHPVFRPDRVVDVQPAQLVGLVHVRGDLDHVSRKAIR
jgi:hypothetical protein